MRPLDAIVTGASAVALVLTFVLAWEWPSLDTGRFFLIECAVGVAFSIAAVAQVSLVLPLDEQGEGVALVVLRLTLLASQV